MTDEQRIELLIFTLKLSIETIREQAVSLDRLGVSILDNANKHADVINSVINQVRKVEK